jgi:hypothetical protein
LAPFADDRLQLRHGWSRDDGPSVVDARARDLTFHSVDVSSSYLPAAFPKSFHEGVSRDPPEIVNLQIGRNELLFEPPDGYRNRLGGMTMIDLECDVWDRYPKAQRVAEAIVPNSWFSHRGLTWMSSVYGQPQYISFDVLDEWDSLGRFFESHGYRIRLSSDGKCADALVELVGGIRNLDVFASKPAYQLLDMLALRSTKKIAQRITSTLGLQDVEASEIESLLAEVEVIPELKGIPKSYEQLYSDARLQGLGRQGLLDLLTRLSDAEVIRRGYYLNCPRCGAPDWHPLSRLHERLTCSGCSFEFILPVQQSAGSEIRWQYRLNTLVNRAMDQDVLPNLLAVHHLTKDRQASCLTTGLELQQNDNAVHEYDFLFVSNQALYAGECKAGSRLEAKDLAKAELAARLGFAAFYFCTVSRFIPEAVQTIEDLRTRLHDAELDIKIEILCEDQLLGEPV